MEKKGPQSRFWTIPNCMSLFRLCLIPLLVWLYCGARNYLAAVCVIALSALTDILDGWVARRFHMVTDVGKILDPVADKLTQGAMILCLLTRYHQMWGVIVLFLAKEGAMLYMGYLSMHYAGSVNSAKWYGKACTVVLELSIAALILLPNLPQKVVDVLLLACMAAMLISLTLYTHFYLTVLRGAPLWNDRKKHGPRIYRIVMLCVWAAIVVACILNRSRFSVDEVLRFTPSSPVLAAVVLLLLFALKSLTVVMYSGILYAASGILFPLPVAIGLNLLGSAVMATVPYFIGKRNGREAVEKIRAKYPKAETLGGLFRKNDFAATLLARMLNLLPYDMVSLYFGASGADYLPYLGASVLGMLRSAITLPIIGTNASNVRSPAFLISVCVEVGLALLSLGICTWIVRRSQKTKETQFEQQPMED